MLCHHQFCLVFGSQTETVRFSVHVFNLRLRILSPRTSCCSSGRLTRRWRCVCCNAARSIPTRFVEKMCMESGPTWTRPARWVRRLRPDGRHPQGRGARLCDPVRHALVSICSSRSSREYICAARRDAAPRRRAARVLMVQLHGVYGGRGWSIIAISSSPMAICSCTRLRCSALLCGPR